MKVVSFDCQTKPPQSHHVIIEIHACSIIFLLSHLRIRAFMSSEFQSDRIKSDFLRLRPKFAAEQFWGVSLWMKHILTMEMILAREKRSTSCGWRWACILVDCQYLNWGYCSYKATFSGYIPGDLDSLDLLYGRYLQ